MNKLLTSLVRTAATRPILMLLALAVITLGGGTFAATQFRVNAEQTGLIAPDSDFQKRYDSFRTNFPAYKRTTLVVIEARSATQAADAASALAEALEKRTDIVQTVFAPAALDFYRRNGLLFLSEADLLERLDAIAAAQPALATMSRDPGLSGLLTLIDGAVDQAQPGEPLPDSVTGLAANLTEAAQAIREDETPPPLTMRGGEETAIQIVTVRLREDLSNLLSPRAKLQAIRDTAINLGLTEDAGINVYLTGNVPLSTDELAQVQESIGLAGAISLLLLILILGFGVRSGRIVAVMFLTLLVGGIWSMGWAMASVGELNILSATFAVLFVGLGIDFAIHFALRAQEAVETGSGTVDALAISGGEVGPAIALGAVTSAIGFLSFLPTEYKGFADLGVIAGGGMICALLASLTVIPAVFALSGIPGHRDAGNGFMRLTASLFGAVSRHAFAISILAAVLAAATIALATQTRFDFSTLSLKNAESESIRTLALLQERGLVTDYAAYVMVDTPEEAAAAAERMSALPTVRGAETIDSLVPGDQDDKRLYIEDTALTLLPVLNAPAESRGTANLPAIEIPATLPKDDGIALTQLADAINALSPAELEKLDAYVAEQTAQELASLREVLSPEPITLDDVPAAARERFVGENGQSLVIGLPKEDLTDIAALRAFVTDVQSAFPEATGRAVMEATVGGVVVTSFFEAIAIAAALVSLVILLATRNVVDTLFVLAPLLLAASATVATGVLIGMPFNQANIIVLPLIMGLGVDNGLHVLMRFRHDGSIDGMLKSSTPRAVILSTLTTIAAFGALGISAHAGTASMGILLTIAMGYLMISTVVVLPAMLYARKRLTA